jgi:hypothetical protein
MEPRMVRNGVALSTWLMILLMATGCASLEAARQTYLMRGQVLDVEDGTAYISLGTEQGAKVGQVFTVSRYVRSGPRGGEWQRVGYVGTVKITKVFSDMAHAKIMTGDVKANDHVELAN